MKEQELPCQDCGDPIAQCGVGRSKTICTRCKPWHDIIRRCLERGRTWDRQRKAHYGDALTCCVSGCEKPRRGNYGMCRMHIGRQERGQPLDGSGTAPPGFQPGHVQFSPPPPVMIGSDHPLWLGDAAGYSGIHARLRAERGNPNDQPCARCGKATGRRDWCFDEPVGYSPDLERYEVRCISCERRISHAQLRDCWYDVHPDTLRKPGHPATV